MPETQVYKVFIHGQSVRDTELIEREIGRLLDRLVIEEVIEDYEVEYDDDATANEN